MMIISRLEMQQMRGYDYHVYVCVCMLSTQILLPHIEKPVTCVKPKGASQKMNAAKSGKRNSAF